MNDFTVLKITDLYRNYPYLHVVLKTVENGDPDLYVRD
jgi:hypothetical protein